jgi:hypothetical protein
MKRMKRAFRNPATASFDRFEIQIPQNKVTVIPLPPGLIPTIE